MSLERIKQFTTNSPNNDLNYKQIKSDNQNQIIYIELDKLEDFENHPFQIRENKDFDELIESIKNIGLIEPIICRTKNDNNSFEIISGHRRLRALKKLGWEKAPIKILDLDDDMAKLYMLESNLIKRNRLLPSEIARAVKMKLDTLKKAKIESQFFNILNNDENIRDQLSKEEEMSKTTLQRYIRLNYLINEILSCVDNMVINEKDKLRISIKVGEYISYLDKKEQFILYQYIIDNHIKKISEGQAKTIKIESEENEINKELLDNIFKQRKIKIKANVKFTKHEMDQYFINVESDQELKELIIKALDLFKIKESS